MEALGALTLAVGGIEAPGATGGRSMERIIPTGLGARGGLGYRGG